MKQFAYIVLLVLFAACSKETDVLPPSVSFNLPVENSFHNVPSSIQVTADISADVPIESVAIRIVDANYIPSSDQSKVYPNAIEYSLNVFIELEDIYLESGQYFVEIAAKAGGELKRKYQSININEYPREYEKLVVAHQSGNVSLIVGQADTLYISGFNNTGLSSNLDLVAINNYYGQILMAYGDGTIKSYDKTSNEVLWEFYDSDPGSISFYNDAVVSEENRAVYFSSNNGEINGFNEFGDNISSVNVGSSFHKADQFIIDNDLIIAEIVDHAETQRFIKVFSLNSGAQLYSQSIEIDINNIVKVNDGQYVIAGSSENAEDDQMLVLHTTAAYAFFYPNNFGFGEILDIVSIGGGNIAIAHTLGVFIYDTHTNDVFPLLGIPEVKDLSYDEVNDVLIMANDNDVTYYAMNTYSVIAVMQFSETVQNIGIVYNK